MLDGTGDPLGDPDNAIDGVHGQIADAWRSRLAGVVDSRRVFVAGGQGEGELTLTILALEPRATAVHQSVP